MRANRSRLEKTSRMRPSASVLLANAASLPVVIASQNAWLLAR